MQNSILQSCPGLFGRRLGKAKWIQVFTSSTNYELTDAICIYYRFAISAGPRTDQVIAFVIMVVAA